MKLLERWQALRYHRRFCKMPSLPVELPPRTCTTFGVRIFGEVTEDSIPAAQENIKQVILRHLAEKSEDD